MGEDIHSVEAKILKFWEDEKIYSFDVKSKKEIFSIDTPPPTVSGKMHIGHAFSYAQQDFIARYKRMRGFNVFYPFGTDDNGLPTERLIEKLNGIRVRDMERQAFIELCLSNLKQLLPSFIQDWKNIGCSCNFNILYSTIDDDSRRISQKSFLSLYKIGREERREAPSIWCPECQTAIAQVELKDKELESHFNDIVFMIDGKEVIIATTRPELLGSCVAVFVHPDDERYKSFIGKKAKVPLYNFEVPVLADKRVDMSKGTGIVMCCTFGDLTDIEWQKAHNLEIKMSIGKDGRMTELAGKYKGLEIKDARKSIIEDLKKQNLLRGQKVIKHIVNVHERCECPIEFIVSKQWFIKYLDLKEKFLELGKKIEWKPEFMRYRYENWIRGLQWDWCISRQRYFGVPFPVWYCKKCDEVIVADEKQLPVDPLKDKPLINQCPKCGCKEFVPETDVLDTWATSSLTPQIAIERAEKIFKTKLKSKLFPYSLRPQAHDIISFWAFNTIVKSWMHEQSIPWKNIMISGFVTLEGEKMSKSKGNVVQPQEIIKKYGVDALRYWASTSKLGEDFDYQEKELVAGQRFMNKLRNASKFVGMFIQDYKFKKIDTSNITIVDKWILSKINELVKSVTKYFDDYEYSKAKAEAEYFFWHIFCDYYLEIVKDRLYNEQRNEKEKESAKTTLYYTFRCLLKIFAPFVPYATEEIWQQLFAKREKCKSIHISSWPEYLRELENKEDEQVGEKVIEIISRVRQEKTKNKKSMKSRVRVYIEKPIYKHVYNVIDDLKAVLNAEIIENEEFKVEFLE